MDDPLRHQAFRHPTQASHPATWGNVNTRHQNTHSPAEPELYTQFDYPNDPENAVVDLSHAHVWDAFTVAALNAITHKYETRGKNVEIVGLNEHSYDRYERHTGQLTGAH